MPKRFLSAAWRHLVMLNYEVDPAILRPSVPKGTALDAWQGKTFVSLVGFQFLGTKLLSIPVPFHRNFPEINLRFYVRREGPEGLRRGVAFVKEIVPRAALAAVARWVYNENYVALPMASEVRLPDEVANRPGLAEYRWAAGGRWHALRAEFAGAPAVPLPGSEAEFITEHYWGYVEQRNGQTLEYHVEHPPWRVWESRHAEHEGDVAGFYGGPYAEALGRPPSSAFVAEGSAVTVFRGRTLSP
jgi:uncharacterized protein YqjF (DUF2071 family)